jgi:hypothetical protein
MGSSAPIAGVTNTYRDNMKSPQWHGCLPALKSLQNGGHFRRKYDNGEYV